LTECGACNAYIVKDGVVATPVLDNQILPGITRQLLLSVLKADGSIPVEERAITMDEVWDADEVWISSSSKEVVPVIKLDGKPVGDGKPGPVWEKPPNSTQPENTTSRNRLANRAMNARGQVFYPAPVKLNPLFQLATSGTPPGR
jgi:hypothetical protein